MVNEKMVNRKSWEEFRESGLLMYINFILQAFGWSIVLEANVDGEITGAYPARVKYRGFSEEVQTRNYQKIAKFMDENSKDIVREAME